MYYMEKASDCFVVWMMGLAVGVIAAVGLPKLFETTVLLCQQHS